MKARHDTSTVAAGRRSGIGAGLARLAIAMVALLSVPAMASVATGVTKWQAGDWRGAVAEWSVPSQRGDADAMFNMGQAYLLGRGVRQDRTNAADLFRRAAAKGHLGATASLGILLWQDGRRTEALQHLRTAADKGELRAAYVLGVATFSGDAVPKNPALGYAYIARARDGGLPVAQQQVGRFATMMTADERMRGEAAAQAMASGRQTGLQAGLPLVEGVLTTPARSSAPVVTATAPDNADKTAGDVPVVKPVTPVATRTAGKTAAKADKKPAAKAEAKGKAAPDETATSERKASAKGEAEAKPATAESFRVQLGAYNSETAARSAWTTLVAQQALLLKNLKPQYVGRGGLVRLQVGSYANRDEARELCQKLSAAGRPCFVTS